MAKYYSSPTQAADSRFAPSSFMPVPVGGPSIEEQNRMANAPAPVARPVQQGQAPAGAANPMDTLNKTLGLNIGAPYEGSMMRQATDAMPAPVQIAGALAGQQDQQKAAQFAQAMQERGGMPQPGSPYFAQQTKVAEAMYNQIYGQQGQPGNLQGAFGQPSTSYAPTGLRGRVLAAGGQEVQGVGGAMVSAGRNAQGGNSFMLRQGAPQSQFMPPSQPMQQVPQAPAGPSAIDQAQGQCKDAIAAMQRPRDNAPSGYRSNPDGTLSFITGGPADPAVIAANRSANLTSTERNAVYAVEQGIKGGYIKPEDKDQAIALFSQQKEGKAPIFPKSERDTAVGNAKYIQSLEALQAATEAIPNGGFGPIENRAKLAANSVLGTYKDYATVDQTYKEAGATKAFGEGGKQLTETEKALTFGQIGDPNSEGFKEQLATHLDRVRNQVELQLERLKASPYQYTPDGLAAIKQLEKALAGKTGGRQSIKGQQDQAPKNVDPAVWSAMTPEEKALWN